MYVARVAVDVPVDTLFDYLPGPAKLADVGCRVLVPFGRRDKIGVLQALVPKAKASDRKLKPIIRVLEGAQPLDEATLKLLDFSARYYHHPIGETIVGALPAGLRRARPPAKAVVRVYGLKEIGRKRVLASPPARPSTQWRILQCLAAEGETSGVVLHAFGRSAPTALRSLLGSGAIYERTLPAPLATPLSLPGCPSQAPTLSQDQEQAVRAICDTPGFKTWLLQGVTGSGKTEVYLRAMEQALARGSQVLYLVPEINLTPQLETFLHCRAAASRLVALHSGLAEGERAQNWLAAQSGEADIVLGTRLAVFTPIPRLGLIIVDEEHDTSYKQQEGLRYCARDIAVMRAKQAGIPIVLGSATPALESYAQTLSRRYRLLRLDRRPRGQTPTVLLVDTRREKLEEGLSATVRQALADRLYRAQQSLVYINRRGYAPVLRCRACRWLAGCPRCSSHLVVHLLDRRLVCHLCGHNTSLPVACPSCGNQDLAPVGHGTQRVEGFLQARFAGARVLRVDRDSTRARLSWQEMRAAIAAEQVDVLVGTQMLAKGHDFPKLTLVAVLNADSALFSTDFRAAERLFAQLMQVAGRAGRAELPGEVLIQTEFPDHPLYQAVVAQDYESFARAQLAERRRAGFPPYAHQVLLRAEASTANAAFDFLERAAAAGRALACSVQIYDPVPAPKARIAGMDQAQLLVQAKARNNLQAFLDVWCPGLGALAGRRVRWIVDVDPIGL